MNLQRFLRLSLLMGLLATMLTACAGGQTTANTTPAPAQQLPAPTPLPTSAPTTATAAPEITFGPSGIGEVMAAQDADLVFGVVGTVAEVLVEEGDEVKKDQVLATLDTRPFDQQVQQAQAQLDGAKAQQAALAEAPRAPDVRAANAQIVQAQAALEEVQAGAKAQDVQSAQAAVTAAQSQLQSTRDQLSFAKTQADAGVEQAAQQLVQAQAAYATAKSNWDFVQDTGNNPQQPSLGVNPQTGKEIENDVSNSQREAIYAVFVQAEAALRQAEQAVQQSQVAAEEARKAEVVGIQSAEQQAIQAQAQLDKLVAPPDKDRLTAAQAALAQAQAGRARLDPNPTDSQQALAASGVAQAEAALELAKLNREKAELRAPFDGVIAQINIDPGDPSATGADPAIAVVDIGKLHVDVQISDVDISRVKIGQIAEVRADASDTIYPGEVSYIAPTATVQGTIRTYLVRIALEKQDGLKPGMSARVDLKVK
jgi:HlyD family secretion protein